MPNLMLTNWCNNKCAYCFGMDQMVPNRPKQMMDDETFLDILSWLAKTDYKAAIHLMGGEPTLHPRFEWIVSELLTRDIPIVVFSNLASERAPEYAEKLGDLPVSWIANIGSPSKWTPEQEARVRASLKALGNKVSISFNIMPDEENDLWPLELIREYGLNKQIKVGFVLPTYTDVNYSLSDNDYKTVAAKVVHLAQEAAKEGVTLQYECGIPTCEFTDEQLGILWECGSELKSGCCSRLDITPEGKLIYCLPLSTVASKHYTEFDTYEQAKNWFDTSLAPYRHLGRCIECATCGQMRPDKCNGACLAKNLIGVKSLNIK